MSEYVGGIIQRGERFDQLVCIVPFKVEEKTPLLGDFLVIEDDRDSFRRVVSVVEDLSYELSHSIQDTNTKRFISKHIGSAKEIHQSHYAMKKSPVLLRTFLLRVLGEITGNASKGTGRIRTDFRMLPDIIAPVRYPTDDELAIICNSGVNSKGYPIGKLSLGEQVLEKDVKFSGELLTKSVTAVMGHPEYGRRNLSKVLTSLVSFTGTGCLVLDTSGEYAFGDGSGISGLADVPGIRGNLAVFTTRPVFKGDFGEAEILPLINLTAYKPWELFGLLGLPLELTPSLTCMLSREETTEGFVHVISRFENDRESDIHQAAYEALCSLLPDDSSSAVEDLPELMKSFSDLLPFHDSHGPNIFTRVKECLAEGKTVVVDLSAVPEFTALSVSNMILGGILEHNARNIYSGSMIPCTVFFEDGEVFLNGDLCDYSDSYFLRWVREGKKYHLGSVFATSHPGEICDQILSLTNNLFMMHLTDAGLVDALESIVPLLPEVYIDIVLRESIAGNVYIFNRKERPYVIPCMTAEFGETLISSWKTQVEGF